ncbi:MAG: DUF1549 and DUF1553 domain-containing protein, partial [Pirellulaceae bacterium]|nr:DUF1549 and DUF1553 domain-containing protein [Pirellulaceae bacterium]
MIPRGPKKTMFDSRSSHNLLPLVLLLLAATSARTEPPAVDLAASDASVSEEDRQHWAYLPVRRPPVPAVKKKSWVRNEIDAFVLHKLEQRGWKPATPAPPQALARRMYLDLVGLPPTLTEQQETLDRSSPADFDELVNRLLDRQGYGERWGRHWLDLVRFAETNGYERDALKPHVWRYRDYVIRSFNEDKPYDRFILEQLAGDELEDDSSETRIATGFYRLGPWDDEPADFAEDRFDQLDDMLNATAQTFLGITLACARCHDHKFEAYTQHDYYKMIAIFNPLSRPQQGRGDRDSAAGSREQLDHIMKRDTAIADQEKIFLSTSLEATTTFLGKIKAMEVESDLPEKTIEALGIERDKRSTDQHQQIRGQLSKILATLVPWLDDEQQAQCQAALAKMKRLKEETPDLPRGYFYVELSPEAPETHLLVRGKAGAPGPVVGPGTPTVLTPAQPDFLAPTERTTQRRLTLARWIASTENPLTARVIVNRVWQHHFGAGIVRSPSDFGVMGSAPTHEQLLDWLADWFVNEGQWSLKKLHRLVMASNSYRMSTTWNKKYAAEDPENNLLWRKPYRRLEVEAIRDSMLAISGKLDRTMYGPSMYPFVPAEILEGHADKTSIWPEFNEAEANRRTIYAYVKRSMIIPFLEVMDLCDTTRPAPKRLVTSVAPQALTMFNGDFANRQAVYFAERLQRETGPDLVKQVRLAYRLAVCREPTRRESTLMQEFLAHEQAR